MKSGDRVFRNSLIGRKEGVVTHIISDQIVIDLGIIQILSFPEGWTKVEEK